MLDKTDLASESSPSNRPSIGSSLEKKGNTHPENEKLSSLILELGKDPTTNLITILDFGPHYLNCKQLNYTEEPSFEITNGASRVIAVQGGGKHLILHGLQQNSDPERLQVFCALLTQQEKRLNENLKLKSLRSYSKTLFEGCPDGIVLIDGNGYIVNTNRAMVTITRKPLNTLIGLQVGRLITGENRAIAFRALRKLGEQTKAAFNCRINIGANRTIPVSISFNNLVIHEQNLILATVRDISYLEEEIRKCSTYEESLARSLDNASDGFVRYDEFGRILEVNPHIEALTGVFGSRLVGRPVDDILTDKSLKEFRRAISRLNRDGYASFPCEIKSSNGTTLSALGTLIQLELEGVRSCRLMLQETKKFADSLS